mgnify:CR=1 FL=1
MKLDKPLYIVGIITIVMTLIFIISISYMVFFPFEPVTFNYDKFKILTPEVKGGDSVKFESSYCRKMDVPVVISRQLINTYLYFYPDVIGMTSLGCQKRVVTLKIPTTSEKGEYFVRNTYRYQVNTLREVVYVKDTEKFKVV